MSTLIELKDLHERVQARFRDALGQHAGRYEALGQRYDRVAHRRVRPEVEALAADLGALLEASEERLRFVAARGAADARGVDPIVEQGAAEQAAFAARNGMRPKESPAELLRRFADRGIVVRELDGHLRVTPADALSEADRSVLLAYKPQLVEVLARAEAVL